MTKTPEQEARETIDKMLDQSGWDVQDRRDINIIAKKGVAIREFPLKSGHGFADYLLYIDGQAAGVIEAKKKGTTLTGVEIQSEKYKTGLPEDLPGTDLFLSVMNRQEWNPIIANVFYRAGIIERWGTGTLNIIDWCAENSNPTPSWQELADSVYVTFLPAALPASERGAEQVTGEVTPQVGTKLALSQHQVDILHKCRTNTPLQVLIKITGRSDRTKFRNQVLNPLLKDDLIEMTVPDKPRSSKQKYRLTEKGKAWLDKYIGKRK